MLTRGSGTSSLARKTTRTLENTSQSIRPSNTMTSPSEAREEQTYHSTRSSVLARRARLSLWNTRNVRDEEDDDVVEKQTFGPAGPESPLAPSRPLNPCQEHRSGGQRHHEDPWIPITDTSRFLIEATRHLRRKVLWRRKGRRSRTWMDQNLDIHGQEHGCSAHHTSQPRHRQGQQIKRGLESPDLCQLASGDPKRPSGSKARPDRANVPQHSRAKAKKSQRGKKRPNLPPRPHSITKPSTSSWKSTRRSYSRSSSPCPLAKSAVAHSNSASRISTKLNMSKY